MSKGAGGGGRGGGHVSAAEARASMFDVRAGARIWNKLPTRSGTFVIRTSVLSSAKRPEGLAETHREMGIREGVARGVKFRAINVSRTSAGKLEVHDGNNRLTVARERGEAFVKVRLDRQ